MSNSRRGKPFSEEHKKALSVAAKNKKPITEEHRRKLSEATKAYWAKRKETTMEGEVDVKY